MIGGCKFFFCFWRFVLVKFEEKLIEMLESGVEVLGFELVGIEFV